MEGSDDDWDDWLADKKPKDPRPQGSAPRPVEPVILARKPVAEPRPAPPLVLARPREAGTEDAARPQAKAPQDPATEAKRLAEKEAKYEEVKSRIWREGPKPSEKGKGKGAGKGGKGAPGRARADRRPAHDDPDYRRDATLYSKSYAPADPDPDRGRSSYAPSSTFEGDFPSLK